MSVKTRVLLTAFEPFAGARLNSSEVVAEFIRGSAAPQVIVEILPVEYDKSLERMRDLIDIHDPEIVIALGQAEGRAKVSFERIAINLDDARIGDNANEIRRERPILKGGTDGYFASFPVRKVVETLGGQGFPVEESFSAGTFVCNHLFYGVMHHLSSTSSNRWMGFIHLPLVSEQSDDFAGKATLDKEVQVQAILAAIEEARSLWKSQG